ncbi:hypothetical protein [Pedobacter ginsengisoli]|uniref:hypothetical protein n=1 Tax=Pedobacter ginsengisoli TaxID=363852 RepID=UPI0025515C1E|nr:hypothetical protein [Pedobacter ginsengisoli]
MKYLLILAFCILTTTGFAQQLDTVFLKPRDKEGHAIFIDPNPNSAYYARIADTAYTRKDREHKESIRRLKSFKVKANKPLRITDIPLNWCKLSLYKGKYYLYAPSDWSYTRVSLSDSIFIEMGMERMIYGTSSFSKTGENSYKISTVADYNGSKSSIDIHVIDPEKGIAVFEYLKLANDPSGRYELMIDVNKIKQFPVIVNYTPQHKEIEFNFDSPDFGALLKGIR